MKVIKLNDLKLNMLIFKNKLSECIHQQYDDYDALENLVDILDSYIIDNLYRCLFSMLGSRLNAMTKVETA